MWLLFEVFRWVNSTALLVVLGYFLYTLWAARRRRRAKAADWGGKHDYYLYYDELGKINVNPSLEAAIDAAHVARVADDQWPMGVKVLTDGFATWPRRLVYGYCPDCGFCTHRDDKERCRPCVAAAFVTKDVEEQKALSREFTLREYPHWARRPDSTWST